MQRGGSRELHITKQLNGDLLTRAGRRTIQCMLHFNIIAIKVRVYDALLMQFIFRL